MPAKDKITWENRRMFITDSVNKVLAEKGSKLRVTLEELEKGLFKHHPLFVDVKKTVCEHYAFCSYRSFWNQLRPWQGKEYQTLLFEPKTSQLQLFNN
ncbi:hypothetical protein [Tenacibaculum sp.]|uniref:hypothetical protein n=1 Tax=Tenacibaculum sp. TaxID=1906242 RepID=UPI003AA93ED2